MDINNKRYLKELFLMQASYEDKIAQLEFEQKVDYHPNVHIQIILLKEFEKNIDALINYYFSYHK